MARVVDMRLASDDPEEFRVKAFDILFASPSLTGGNWSSSFLLAFQGLQNIVEPGYEFYVTEATNMFKFTVPYLTAERFLRVIDWLSVLEDVWALDWGRS